MPRCIALAALLCFVPLTYGGDPPPPNPKHVVDYVQWANDTVGRGVADNAADLYREAAAGMKHREELLVLAIGSGAWKWSEEQRQALQQYVQSSALSLERFESASKKRQCFLPIEGAAGFLLGARPAGLPQIHDLSRLVAGRARLRALAGDVDASLRDVALLLRVADHMQSGPLLIEYMLGLAIDTLAYEVLLDLPLLAPGRVDYGRVPAKLAALDTPLPDLTGQFRLERIGMWDYAQRAVQDTDGDGRYDLVSTAGPGHRYILRTELDPPVTLREMIAQIDGFYDQYQKVFSLGYADARRRAKELDEKARAADTTVLGTLSPSLAGFVTMPRKVMATRCAYRVVYALHAHRDRHGDWPKVLSDALSAPSGEKQKLSDPFSGQPLGYRLKEGQPLVYSVGVDGVDSGGEVRRKGGRITWGAEGGDYVFWPRPVD